MYYHIFFRNKKQPHSDGLYDMRLFSLTEHQLLEIIAEYRHYKDVPDHTMNLFELDTIWETSEFVPPLKNDLDDMRDIITKSASYHQVLQSGHEVTAKFYKQ